MKRLVDVLRTRVEVASGRRVGAGIMMMCCGRSEEGRSRGPSDDAVRVGREVRIGDRRHSVELVGERDLLAEVPESTTSISRRLSRPKSVTISRIANRRAKYSIDLAKYARLNAVVLPYINRTT